MSTQGKSDRHMDDAGDEVEVQEASLSELPLTALSEFGHF